MQFDTEAEKCKQLFRIVDTVLKEAIWDYSSPFDMSVVNINGQPLIFNNEQLKILNSVKAEIEEKINE